MEDSIPQKQCTGPCQQILPATTEFFRAMKGRRYGVHSWCKACESAYKRAYQQTHKEEIRAYKQVYHQVHREDILKYHKDAYQANREERLVQSKIYRQSHQEERRSQKKIYRQRHKEKLRAYHKKYKETHKEEGRASEHKHRALKHGNGGTHTAADVQKQHERQKGKCYYCAVKLSKGKNAYHVDHIIPLSRGGSNDPSNLVITCPTCNLKKQDKLPHEWPEGGRLL